MESVFPKSFFPTSGCSSMSVPSVFERERQIDRQWRRMEFGLFQKEQSFSPCRPTKRSALRLQSRSHSTRQQRLISVQLQIHTVKQTKDTLVPHEPLPELRPIAFIILFVCVCEDFRDLIRGSRRLHLPRKRRSCSPPLAGH